MTTDEVAAEIVVRCRERVERGESVDPEEVIRAHPDMADNLRERFAALRRLDQAFARGSTAQDTGPRSLVGRVLGPYRLLSVLGAGGMGSVYLAAVEGEARGLARGAQVAVKVVHPHLFARQGFFKRFLREAEVGRRVRHENVVRTLDVDEDASCRFLVMEYVEGQTLRALLDELERVPEELCRHVGCEIAKALAAIHAEGAVHRDVKPENVLITKDNVVKVMDLGVARLADEEMRLSQTGAFVGSVRYAAPEQFKGRDTKLDGRADLYALGLTLYELATGAHPFADEEFHAVLRRQMTEVPRPAGELNPQVSPFLEELLVQLLDKDREKRVASAAELARILDEGERSAWWTRRAQAIRAETKRTLRRIRIPRETAVVGRDAELAKLRSLFDAAKAGEGHVVLVEGEAGIGKSRLVDEFVARLRSEGEDLNFLFGSYPPGGAATSSGAFSTAYREHFGVEGLGETLVPYLGPSPILVPAFAALLRGEGTPEGAEPLTKDSLQTCFVHATRALAAERTTIVLVDDLHFAPEEGRALFTSLALAVPGHRILLVGTTRPTRDEKWIAGIERLGHLARLPLARLGPKDLVVLLRDALRSENLAQELSAQIAVKSDGNPYFVFEILRGMKEGQFLTQKPDGTWVTTQILRDIQIPSSVLELVQARVADLAEDDRNLLDVASCLGFEFDPLLVGDVLGMARIPLLRRLGQIERAHRLVRAAGQRYVFDHHQVQEALYGSLSELLRAEYHAAIAEALDARTGAAATEPKDLDGALCVDLADHFLKGAQGAKALRYLDSALSHLERNYLNDEAVRLADRALATSGLVGGRERCELLLRTARTLDPLGRHDAERVTLDEALALADIDGDSSLRARVRRAVGAHLHRHSHHEQALARLSEALDLARAAGDWETEAAVIGHVGNVFWSLGRYEEALEHHGRTRVFARETDHRRLEAQATGNLGLVFRALGRREEARAHYVRQLALCREIDYRRGEAIGTGNLGALLMELGHYAEAREHREHHLALAREIGDRPGEARALLHLGVVLHGLGRLAEAREHQERSLTLAREIYFRALEGSALLSVADLDAEDGNATATEQRLAEALEVFRAIGFCRAEALCARGALLARRGRTEESRAALGEALAIAHDLSLPSVEVLATAQLARLPGGDVAAALVTLAAHEGRVWVSDAMEARSLLWQATRDPTHLAEAKRRLDFLVAHAPPDCRESMLSNVRLHREIAAAAKEHGL